jgi:hypothetical protein
MKTSELTGAALDWAVAKCEQTAGRNIREGYGGSLLVVDANDFGAPAAYSTDWAQGGPIIERENITIERNVKLRGCAVVGFYDWRASHPKNYGGLIRHSGVGPAPLIAAMRCYVASKLGDEVYVPEELV